MWYSPLNDPAQSSDSRDSTGTLGAPMQMLLSYLINSKWENMQTFHNEQKQVKVLFLTLPSIYIYKSSWASFSPWLGMPKFPERSSLYKGHYEDYSVIDVGVGGLFSNF